MILDPTKIKQEIDRKIASLSSVGHTINDAVLPSSKKEDGLSSIAPENENSFWSVSIPDEDWKHYEKYHLQSQSTSLVRK